MCSASHATSPARKNNLEKRKWKRFWYHRRFARFLALSFLGFIFIYFFIFHFITGAIPNRSLSWDEILRISLSLFNVNWFIVITRNSWVELLFPDEFILVFKMDEKMRSQCEFLEKSDVNRKKLISLRNGILRGLE